MYFWRGAVHVGGAAQESGIGGRTAGGEYHGSHTDGQYPAIRHVQFARQSGGGGRYRRCIRRTDAYALHTGYRFALDTWCGDGLDRLHAGAGQCVEMHVHVGRRRQYRSTCNGENHDSLRASYRVRSETMYCHSIFIGVKYEDFYNFLLWNRIQ
jgi:hypothetical protein